MDRSKQNQSLLSSSFKSPLVGKDQRSPFSMNRATSGKSSSRFSAITGRSNQSVQAICKSPYHVVEKFGAALPVQVTEALTFTDRSSAVSVHITMDGWAWFVCGRRLLIWQCKPGLDTRRQGQRPFAPINSQCRELTLPPSDLAHKGDLVSVYTPQSKQVPSCIAVSPEGTIRYWPSIAHEGSSVEINIDLQGQECDSLTNIGDIGCILATTTSTIVLVQTEVSGGKHKISCHMIRTPQGWLGGLGKRMSSLIFGGLPSSQVAESKLVKVVAVDGQAYRSNDWRMYVLGERSLQKWLLSGDPSEHLVYEVDMNPIVKEAFFENVWESSAGDPSELEVWLLDMQPVDDGVMILVASVYTQVSTQLHYAIGKICTENPQTPTRFSSFIPLKNTALYRQQSEAQILSFKFLLYQQEAYLFNQKGVIICSFTQPGEELATIEFATPGDLLLGGALCGNIPVFFSKSNGLLSISPSDLQANDDYFNSSVASFNDGASHTDSIFSEAEGGVTVAVTDTELEEMTLNKDESSKFKAAFIFYIKKQIRHSQEIIGDLFPPEAIIVMDIDTHLDTCVVQVSKDLMDDTPLKDPRWTDVKTSSASVGSSTSLQIIQQLNDKHHALNLYFSFLKDLNLWERLTSVTIRNYVMAVPYILREQAEKVVAMIALRTLQPNHSTIIDLGIKAVVEKQKEKPPPNLTHQDLFYREVTQMHRIIQVLVQWSNSIVHSDRSPQEVATLLSQVNTIILTTLQEVLRFRERNIDNFSPKTRLSPGIGEYLPWTAAPGKDGLRDSLMMQQSLTLNYGTLASADVILKNELYDQLVNLLDIILDGRKAHLESIRGTDKFDILYQKYEMERYAMLEPFLDVCDYERAAILAEKYCDFKILVQICEVTDDKERLEKYMERLADQDFSKFVFNWYIGEQKHGRLLEQFGHQKKQSNQQQALSQFLGNHPSLSWLQNVFNGEFKEASHTLLELAKEETELLGRKRSMLSLAKLALLAGNDDETTKETVEHLNCELDLIRYQEDLPEAVLAAYGYDTEQLRVLTPAELIKLFICDDNASANEFDFKKALDLLKYIEDDFEHSELKLSIWCQAIKRDSWEGVSLDSPINAMQKLLFFKLVNFINLVGGNGADWLPPIDLFLDASELGELTASKNFQYLLKVGYEHVHNSMSDQ